MRTIGNICIIIFVLLSLYTLRGDLTPVAQDIGTGVEHAVMMLGQEGSDGTLAQQIPATATQLEQKISAPGTAVVSSNATATSTGPTNLAAEDQSTINQNDEEIIEDTNQARKDNGDLPALTENPVLDETASEKVDDMFQNQYFAHVSPTGVTIATQATAAGYDYILIGENLALGNFDGMSGIVDAWMGSPGHRANILNPHYTDIGVSVKEGIYKGEEVTIAVQHFGLPGSTCPSVDATLKSEITSNQDSIDSLKAQMDTDKQQINSMSQYALQYGSLVTVYNGLVDQYNALVVQTTSQINTYNKEVTTHNTCLQSFTS